MLRLMCCQFYVAFLISLSLYSFGLCLSGLSSYKVPCMLKFLPEGFSRLPMIPDESNKSMLEPAALL